MGEGRGGWGPEPDIEVIYNSVNNKNIQQILNLIIVYLIRKTGRSIAYVFFPLMIGSGGYGSKNF